jgi:hypothetical protein
MNAEILNTESGTVALCEILKSFKGTVYIPSDICTSVTDGLLRLNKLFKFYPVVRGWKEEGDIYEFESSEMEDAVYIVSDLFNFRSIKVSALKGKIVILDLAHCSFSTAEHYVEKLIETYLNVDLLGVTFSFGSGKYLRLGGGGCAVRVVTRKGPLEYFGVFNKLADIYGPKEIRYKDLNLIYKYFDPDEIATCEFSTRMIIKPKNFENGARKINKLREVHNIDISDGLFDHLTVSRRPEFYVWKGTET